MALNFIPVKYINWLSQWEAGYSNKKNDKGKETNRGWSRGTFDTVLNYGQRHGFIDKKYNQNSFFTIDDNLFKQLHNTFILMHNLNYIRNVRIRLLIYEYILGSETAYYRVAKILQNFTNIKVSNYSSQLNASIINSFNANQEKLFLEELTADKFQQFKDIVKQDPGQADFSKGWVNRMNSFIKTDFGTISTGIGIIGTFIIILGIKLIKSHYDQ